MFKSDGQSVQLSRRYSYADAVAADQSGAIQMVHVMNPATVRSLLQNAPDRVVNRIEIWAVWWLALWPDEVRHLGRQQFNRFAITVNRVIILLKPGLLTRP